MALRRWTFPVGSAVRTLREPGHGVRVNLYKPSSTALMNEIDTREHEIVSLDFTNRNPHNLEQMALARKDLGWKTSWPTRDYWYRVRLEQTQNHVEGYIEHCSGQVVVSASTREWAIKKHLHKTTGVTACKNVGRVLAQRCLEAGINFVDDKATIPWEEDSETMKHFKNAMTEGGIVLKELERISNKYVKKKLLEKPTLPSLEETQ